MPASELIERVAELIDRAARELDQPFAAEFARLEERLREPMRVAVVGRVKAGKSTIVNALLGQRVAPTGASECTQFVTWFRYGRPQRIVIDLKDGSEASAPFSSAGMLPDVLPVAADRVAGIRAYLANEALKGVTLIDTPGLGSVHSEYSDATMALIDLAASTSAATAQADAVLFVMNDVVMEDEHDVMELLAAGANGRGSAVNTVGILSKADKLGDGLQDPWLVATELAAGFSRRFNGELATVVPVVGLMAESSEAATLTEFDFKNLRLLAGLEDDDLGSLMWSPDRFVGRECAVSPDGRIELLQRLDLYGITRAVDLVKRREVSATTDLRARLAQMSGFSQVKGTLSSLIDERDDILKVRSVLDLLDQLTYRRSGPTEMRTLFELRSAIESLREDESMHAIAEVEAFHEICSRKVALPSPLDEQFRRLMAQGSPATRVGAESDSPSAVADAAIRNMRDWRTFVNDYATPQQKAVARVSIRSFEIILRRARDQTQSESGAPGGGVPSS